MSRKLKQESKKQSSETALSENSSESLLAPDGQQLRLEQLPSEDPATGKVRVLVYGSLKQKCGNHCLLEQVDATWLGYDSITGDFSMMSFGSFPGVVRTDYLGTSPNRGPRTIFGELYMMDEEGLAALDMLESHPRWYERFKYRTDVLDYRAWMYTLPGGEGYLDEDSYAGVDECIWQPKPDELGFWNEQDGITLNVS